MIETAKKIEGPGRKTRVDRYERGRTQNTEVGFLGQKKGVVDGKEMHATDGQD